MRVAIVSDAAMSKIVGLVDRGHQRLRFQG
jgi:hypothetical protein